MQRVLMIALLALLAAVTDAAADPPSVERARLHRSTPQGHQTLLPHPPATREGGEDVPTAIAIPGDVSLLPFLDTGSTCDNVNDYDESCPYTGSTAPDVVYGFTPTEDIVVDLDLCASSYDTKAYVYDAWLGLVACNDDGPCGYSGWQSRLRGIALVGGETYYIIVDGYGSSCGVYALALERSADCSVECPPGAIAENEPPCQDGYVDQFNGGCGPPVSLWSLIVAGADGCATICGRSCTFDFGGEHFWDTDWYEGTAGGGQVTVSCEAEFLVGLVLDPYTDCSISPEGVFAEAEPCTPVQVAWPFAPGQRVWLFVAPLVQAGLPESDYVFTICGLEPLVTPVESTSWGRIKKRYRTGGR